MKLSRAAGWLPGSWALRALAVVGLAAAGLRIVAALAVRAPWLLPDEAAYALAGRAFWHHGELAVLGGPAPYVSTLYPLVAALPYAALRVVQVFALCSTAVVVYVWARSLTRAWWAAGAAVLTLALPGLAYAGEIVAETLFLPLATLAGWLAMRALASPTTRRQVELVVALAACALTQGEANMIAIAVFAASLAARRVRALWPTWLSVAAMCVVWAALGGGSPLRSLGSYGSAAYTVHGVFDFVLEHAGDLLLVSGMVPVCAAVLLAMMRPREAEVRAAVSYALALGAAASIEVGVFAAGHAGRLLERELLFALPPFFVAFAVWLDRGAPRPRLRTAAVVAIAVAVLLAEPFGRLATAAAVPDNPSLVALTHLDSAKIYGVVALVALVGGAGMLFLRAHQVWLLPVLLAVVFVAASVSASEEFVDRSQAARSAYTTRTVSWLDRAGAPVTYLYDGFSDWQLGWEQLFWNGRVGHVLDLPATHVPGPLPQSQLQLLPGSGALRLVGGGVPQAGLIAAPAGFHFRGRRLATAPQLGLSLWQVDAPPRVSTWVQGLLPNGEIAEHSVATLSVFDCGRGTFHLIAIGHSNETLRLMRDSTPVATTQLWPQGVWEQTISTPAAAPGSADRCTFTLSSTSVVQLTTFAWTPG